MFVMLLSLVACKKDPPPEAAGEAVQMDPATSVSVTMHSTEVKRVRAFCKDTGAESSAPVSDGQTVLLGGISGDQCRLFFKPELGSFGPIDGGQSWDCWVESGKDPTCKAR